MNIPFEVKKFDTVDDAEWIQGGKAYFDRICEYISGASESIYLQTYILEPDETGNRIITELKEAAQRGVFVQVLVDAFGSSDLSDRSIKILQKQGINIRKYSPVFLSRRVQLGRRLHHKIIVIDSKITIVGGINISNRYAGNDINLPWLDFALIIYSSSFGENAKEICDKKFNKTLLSSKNTLDTNWDVYDKEKIYAQLVRNDWLKGKIEITRSYREAIRKARKRILLTGTYFLPDNRIRKLLAKAARRGVKITMVFSEKSDVQFLQNSSRYLYHWLIKHNIELLEWQPSTIHAKVVLVDDYFISVGSYNINPLSKFGGIEMNANIISTKLSSSFWNHWNHLTSEKCIRIEPDKLSRKYSLSYFVQMFSYYFANILFRFIKTFDQL